MPNASIQQAKGIEPTSYIWRDQFIAHQVPVDGIIVEVAPGYEPKIGNALALYGFTGTIFLIEPDRKAAQCIQKIYTQILPQAVIKIIVKALQDVAIGADLPRGIDALVASHPFDDMVVAFVLKQASFFSKERKDGTRVSATIKNLYSAINDTDYASGIKHTITTWQNFIRRAQPVYVIASQYPSRTLTIKKLAQRQESGFIVLRELKNFYKHFLQERRLNQSFGYKGDPRWWIVIKQPRKNIASDLNRTPAAMERLDQSIFVPHEARKLCPNEYDLVYVDDQYFKDEGYGAITKHIHNFAIDLLQDRASSAKTKTTYADRQKDKTDIGLSGNHGSGRAVYYGERFNILGIGKTTLCKSTVPSHSTGRIELIGAMRRLILSKWINCFTKITTAHPLLIALKETAQFKWNPNPIPLAILVRVDDGSMDRPSHVEYAPQIPIDFQKTLTKYAMLDAEYFAYRIMLGAWSASNYSLNGHIIDLETASFVKYRGPYHTASDKYPDNLFGYEGLGFLKILRGLADLKNISNKKIKNQFYAKRSEHLGCCFLLLLGIRGDHAVAFFSRHQNRVIALSRRFEKLAKKISPQKTRLKLYMTIAEDHDPSLLDMSRLFRNLARLYKSCGNVEESAFDCLIRKRALLKVKRTRASGTLQCAEETQTQADIFIMEHAVITRDKLNSFLRETKNFIRDVFKLLTTLDSEKCLNQYPAWNERLRKINQDIPPMFELNNTLRGFAEDYRLKKISPEKLGKKIEKLSALPYQN